MKTPYGKGWAVFTDNEGGEHIERDDAANVFPDDIAASIAVAEQHNDMRTMLRRVERAFAKGTGRADWLMLYTDVCKLLKKVK